MVRKSRPVPAQVCFSLFISPVCRFLGTSFLSHPGLRSLRKLPARFLCSSRFDSLPLFSPSLVIFFPSSLFVFASRVGDIYSLISLCSRRPLLSPSPFPSGVERLNLWTFVQFSTTGSSFIWGTHSPSFPYFRDSPSRSISPWIVDDQPDPFPIATLPSPISAVFFEGKVPSAPGTVSFLR